LTDTDVAAIRSAVGVSQRELAARHGISGPQISLILSGKRW
jgi:transcriptional regulator with XRE-family HTH domain